MNINKDRAENQQIIAQEHAARPEAMKKALGANKVSGGQYENLKPGTAGPNSASGGNDRLILSRRGGAGWTDGASAKTTAKK